MHFERAKRARPPKDRAATSAHLKPAERPITEDDAFIARALEDASIPTLMMSMVHMSGDTGLLRGRIRPRTPVMGEVQGYLSEPEKAEIRAEALEVIRAYRDHGCTLPPPPAPQTIHEMMNFMVGAEVGANYLPLMLEEMALDGRDARVSGWQKELPASVRDGFHVVIIGAGMSGLLAALRLKEAGIRFTVLEKSMEVGGTWHENRYPGCRVDISNHFYSYSMEPNHEWSEYFARQDELARYFREFADRHDLRRSIRFGTEVVSAVLDEARSVWHVTIRRADGSEETLDANALISAVGQLNRPLIPTMRGQDKFRGPAFHTACWESHHKFDGKRIAVIGTGASAFQVVPELAKIAARVYVFQRSPIWMFPNPDYHAKVSGNKKWLLKHLPYYARWYRFLVFWPGSGAVLANWTIDPNWPHQERSVSAGNEQERIALTEWIRQQVGDQPELLAKVIPTYPPGGKRMLQDNGSWLRALKQPNVELVTEALTELDETGIVGRDRHYDVDAIIYATGFHANKFLWPMDIVGCGGVKLNEFWGDEPRAYLGITVPGFPNLFCLYGPGTNLAHAGSIIFNSECQVRYTISSIQRLLERGCRTIECRREVYDDYNRRLAQALDKLVWSHPGVNNWFKNRAGRVVNTSPWPLPDYWQWTRNPDAEDYDFR